MRYETLSLPLFVIEVVVSTSANSKSRCAKRTSLLSNFILNSRSCISTRFHFASPHMNV